MTEKEQQKKAWYQVIADQFKSLPKWTQVSLFIAGFIILSFIFSAIYVGEKINEYAQINQPVTLEKLRQQNREKVIMDSINRIRKIEFMDKAIKDELKIIKQCQRYSRLLQNEDHLTLFRVHDHGDPYSPSTSAPLVSVKWSSRDNFKENYQNRPINKGALWATHQASMRGQIWMPDVRDFPEYWTGKEKVIHAELGNYSGVYQLVTKLPSGYFFIAVHFSDSKSVENINKMLLSIEDMAYSIEPLIYDVPEELKN